MRGQRIAYSQIKASKLQTNDVDFVVKDQGNGEELTSATRMYYDSSICRGRVPPCDV